MIKAICPYCNECVEIVDDVVLHNLHQAGRSLCTCSLCNNQFLLAIYDEHIYVIRISERGDYYKIMKEYVEEYRGYTIRRMGDAINIYDKNGCYVKRVDTLVISAAKRKVDEIIKRTEE